jgi:hypothetical protein
MLPKSAFLLALLTATATLAVGCSAPSNEEVGSSESRIGSISYDAVMNLEGAPLKVALNGLIKNQVRVGYDNARKFLFTDPRFRNADGKLECVYTGRLVTPTGSLSAGGFNTEHTWPQSLGASREPAKSDLHHLWAVDGRMNSTRGNWPFGNVTCLPDLPIPSEPPADAGTEADAATDAGSSGSSTGDGGDAGTDQDPKPIIDETTRSSNENEPELPRCMQEEGGSALGKDSSNRTTFEVRLAHRGNVARAIFYFSVRYNLAVAPAEEAALRVWHVQDPVDAAESARNDVIDQVQHNRNPFIDHPEFVAKITDF